jgi:hypothetical protein
MIQVVQPVTTISIIMVIVTIPLVCLDSVFRDGKHKVLVRFADVILYTFSEIGIRAPEILYAELPFNGISKSVVANCLFKDMGIN